MSTNSRREAYGHKGFDFLLKRPPSDCNWLAVEIKARVRRSDWLAARWVGLFVTRVLLPSVLIYPGSGWRTSVRAPPLDEQRTKTSDPALHDSWHDSHWRRHLKTLIRLPTLCGNRNNGGYSFTRTSPRSTSIPG